MFRAASFCLWRPILTIKKILFETFEQTSISCKCSSSIYGSRSTTASMLTGPVPKCISTISIYLFCWLIFIVRLLLFVMKRRREKNKKMDYIFLLRSQNICFMHRLIFAALPMGLLLVCGDRICESTQSRTAYRCPFFLSTLWQGKTFIFYGHILRLSWTSFVVCSMLARGWW